jgi:hypothetical protein
VVREVADGPGESLYQPLVVGKRHFGISTDHPLGAAVWRTGCGILEGHCPGQPEGFLGADIGGRRTPPIAGPQAMLSIAVTALRPPDERWTWTSFNGPSSSAKQNTSSITFLSGDASVQLDRNAIAHPSAKTR